MSEEERKATEPIKKKTKANGAEKSTQIIPAKVGPSEKVGKSNKNYLPKRASERIENKKPGKSNRKLTVRPNAERRREDLDRLNTVLAGLRGVHAQIAEQLTLKIQGRIAGLQSRAAGFSKVGDSTPPLPWTNVETALAILAELQLKPKKGRLKDLVNISEAVDLLRKLMLTDQD